MSTTALLLPVFAQVFLTFALHVWMARLRVGAVRRGEVGMADIGLRQHAWPARVTQIGNSYHSQLELPLLFYVLIAFVLITGTGNYLLLALAWLFVVSRFLHAAIHTTSNGQPGRFYSYAAGLVILAVMWTLFAVRIITGPAFT